MKKIANAENKNEDTRCNCGRTVKHMSNFLLLYFMEGMSVFQKMHQKLINNNELCILSYTYSLQAKYYHVQGLEYRSIEFDSNQPILHEGWKYELRIIKFLIFHLWSRKLKYPSSSRMQFEIRASPIPQPVKSIFLAGETKDVKWRWRPCSCVGLIW